MQVIDLYALPAFTGCISCFGCKLPNNLGRCVCREQVFPTQRQQARAMGADLVK